MLHKKPLAASHVLISGREKLLLLAFADRAKIKNVVAKMSGLPASGILVGDGKYLRLHLGIQSGFKEHDLMICVCFSVAPPLMAELSAQYVLSQLIKELPWLQDITVGIMIPDTTGLECSYAHRVQTLNVETV